MKKVLLSIFTVLLSITLSAQINITSDDIVGAGAIVIEATDSIPSPSITPGPSGPDQIWDFSALAVDNIDTMWFMNPDWTPYYDYFPASNLAMMSISDSILVYFDKNENEFAMLGIAGEMEDIGFVVIPIVPKEILANFPVEYLNSNTSTFEQFLQAASPYPPADSMKMKITTTKTLDVDAWGSLTTPLGTFNSLRINETRIQIDSIWVQLSGSWMFVEEAIDTTNSYSWWSDDNATGFVLVTLDCESDAKTVTEASFLMASPYYSIEENKNDSFLNVYPNPVSSNINFSFKDKTKGVIKFFDFTGRNIKDIQLNNVREIIINMSEYPTGIYLFSIIGENGNIIHSGKIGKE